MNILAMDTSNQTCSVAVVSEGVILGELSINKRRNHSLQLMPAIEDVLKQTGLTLDDLDVVAVAKGPGSYTGLRIAATTAKTLAWANQLSLRSVSSLKVYAAEATVTAPHLIVPLFDARRGNVYTGLYQYSAEGVLSQIEKDTHIDLERWLDYLAAHYPDHKIQLVSAMAETEKMATQIKGKENVILLEKYPLPHAGILGLLALREKDEDIHSFSPEYIKLAEAEANWLKNHPEQIKGNWVSKIEE